MQNKQAIVGIIAAVVILLGAGGVFLYSQNKSADTQPNSTTTATEEKNAQSSMSDSITSLLRAGKTQQCTFSYTDPNGSTSKGSAYITGDKMRTDLTINSNEEESNLYMIRSGDDNYIWGSQFPNNTGFKMTLSLEDLEGDTDSKKYFDPTKKVDYNCSGWTADSTIFTPPSNVKFSDLSAMMESMMKISKTPTNGAGNSSQCSVCNSLTGDAKTACLEQLGC